MKKFVKVIGTANVNNGITEDREQEIYYSVDEIKCFEFFRYRKTSYTYGKSEPAVKVVFKNSSHCMVSKDVELFKGLLNESTTETGRPDIDYGG